MASEFEKSIMELIELEIQDRDRPIMNRADTLKYKFNDCIRECHLISEIDGIVTSNAGPLDSPLDVLDRIKQQLALIEKIIRVSSGSDLSLNDNLDVKGWLNQINALVSGGDSGTESNFRGLQKIYESHIGLLKSNNSRLYGTLTELKDECDHVIKENRTTKLAMIANHSAYSKLRSLIKSHIASQSDKYPPINTLMKNPLAFAYEGSEATVKLAQMTSTEILEIRGVGQATLENIKKTFIDNDLLALCSIGDSLLYDGNIYPSMKNLVDSLNEDDNIKLILPKLYFSEVPKFGKLIRWMSNDAPYSHGINVSVEKPRDLSFEELSGDECFWVKKFLQRQIDASENAEANNPDEICIMCQS